MSGRPAWLLTLLIACGRHANSDTPRETGDSTIGTGPLQVPRGADTNGDNFVDRLFLDRYAVQPGVGDQLLVTVDNGPDQGDGAIFVFDGDDVVASGSHDVPCTYPAINDPETGCPAVDYTPTAAQVLFIGIGVWVSYEDIATYSFAEFTVGGASVEPSLVDDDLPFNP